MESDIFRAHFWPACPEPTVEHRGSRGGGHQAGRGCPGITQPCRGDDGCAGIPNVCRLKRGLWISLSGGHMAWPTFVAEHLWRSSHKYMVPRRRGGTQADVPETLAEVDLPLLAPADVDAPPLPPAIVGQIESNRQAALAKRRARQVRSPLPPAIVGPGAAAPEKNV